MKKSDARVRYTERILKESFLAVLREKPVNKITVKEVCELAEINRATFYAHYSDCFALMESIEEELVDAFSQSLKHTDSLMESGVIEAIYEMIDQHKEACQVLIFNGASNSILGKMVSRIREERINIWRKHLKHASDEELEMLYTHLSNGLMHVVVGGYDKYHREDVINFVNRIVKSSYALFQ